MFKGDVSEWRGVLGVAVGKQRCLQWSVRREPLDRESVFVSVSQSVCSRYLRSNVKGSNTGLDRLCEGKILITPVETDKTQRSSVDLHSPPCQRIWHQMKLPQTATETFRL